MIHNPNRRPDGTMPPVDVNPPELSPEIAEYFRERQSRLRVVHTTRTPQTAKPRGTVTFMPAVNCLTRPFCAWYFVAAAGLLIGTRGVKRSPRELRLTPMLRPRTRR